MTTDWHPLFSYEWWRDIGTGLMSVATAVLVGGSTVFVAIRSHRFARKVREQEEIRSRDADSARYRENLLRSIEASSTALVAYGNELQTSKLVATPEDRRLRAAVIARINLLQAVADPEDRQVVTVVGRGFSEVTSTDRRWNVRVQVTGECAETLAKLLGRASTNENLIKEFTQALGKHRTAAEPTN